MPLAVLLLLTACRKTNEPTAYSLGIDMQRTFDQDNVQVFIDNQPILNKQITSNNVLGLASSISTNNTDGNHTIKVIVNDSLTVTQPFTQHGDLYVGINYIKSANMVMLTYSNTRFLYD